MIRQKHFSIALVTAGFLWVLASSAQAQVEEVFEVFGGAAKPVKESTKKDAAEAAVKPQAEPKQNGGNQAVQQPMVIAEDIEALGVLNLRVAVAAAPNPKIDFLKPLVNCELSFIHRVCDPDDLQMKKIVNAARLAHSGMKEMVVGGRNVNVIVGQQQVMFNGPNGERLNGNPYDRIRSDAKEYLKPLITEAQYSTYLEEFDARKRYERACSVDLAMAVLDRKVGLLDAQREEIRKIMMSKFELDLGLMNIYIYNPQFAPPWPNEIHQELSAMQRDLLKGGPRVFNTMQIGQGPDLGLKDWMK